MNRRTRKDSHEKKNSSKKERESIPLEVDNEAEVDLPAPLALLTAGQGKDSTRLMILCFMVLFGCSLFISGFMMERDYHYDVENIEHYPFEKCFAPSNKSDDILKPSLRVVFMVIDAWRLDFLTSPDSPMNFSRQAIEKGRAVLFKGFAQTPTVTMPRIKALTSGSVPGFASAFLNFATTETTEDSWVQQAFERHRRIRFYGDDTWLRLFPTQFDQSEGVTSFYVNDYIQVDQNVTRNMRRQVKEDDWDILILHYLGLDHIGHSLGGTSPQIPVKLEEMDRIIEEIFTTLSQKGPTLLVVVGDHGMTEFGSHGGGSSQETQVPLLFFHSAAHVKEGHNWKEEEKFYSAYQLDVASTMSSFLRLPIPKQSRGLTLVPLMERYWYMEQKTMFFEELYQAIQLRRYIIHGPVIEELISAGPSANKEKICDAAKDIVKEVRSYYKFLRNIQRRIIRALESTWEPSSSMGLFFIIVVTVMAFEVDARNIYENRFKDWSLHDYVQVIVALVPIISCFASSLIEEEHDVWNYSTCFVIVFRVFCQVRDIVLTSNTSDTEEEGSQERDHKNVWSPIKDGLIILTLHRFAVSLEAIKRRRWKMDPSLLPAEYFKDFGFLQQVKVMGAWLEPNFLATSLMPMSICSLCCLYFFRRLSLYAAVTKRTSSIRFILLLFFCLSTFCMRALCISLGKTEWLPTLFYPMLFPIFLIFLYSPSLSLLLYLCYLVRPQYLPLLVAVFEMGVRSRQLGIHGYFLFHVLSTLYYHMGASFSIASIDVGIGYTGLSSYTPIIVALQIGLNMYAAPIMFILAYNLFPSGIDNASSESVANRVKHSKEWNEDPFCAFLICHARIVLCSAAIISMGYFHEHLFIWTVFGPKAMFEVFHTCVLLLITMGLILYSWLARWSRKSVQGVRKTSNLM